MKILYIVTQDPSMENLESAELHNDKQKAELRRSDLTAFKDQDESEYCIVEVLSLV